MGRFLIVTFFALALLASLSGGSDDCPRGSVSAAGAALCK